MKNLIVTYTNSGFGKIPIVLLVMLIYFTYLSSTFGFLSSNASDTPIEVKASIDPAPTTQPFLIPFFQWLFPPPAPTNPAYPAP